EVLFGGQDAGQPDTTNIWIEPGPQGLLLWTADTLHSIHKDGSQHVAIVPPRAGITLPGGYALASNGTKVFWIDRQQTRLVSSPHDAVCNAPCPTDLAAADQPYRIAMDDRYLYWGGKDGVIVAVTPDGKTVLPLATAPGVAYGLAVDDQAVYWTTQF